MGFQTTYDLDPAALLPGMVASSAPCTRRGRICEGTPVVGLLVQNGTLPDMQVKPIAALAADVDSILASGGASAASAQLIEVASANGVIGGGRIVPAQQITITLSSHANWDVGEAKIAYEDVDGKLVTEKVIMPDAGNVTITTLGAASRFVSAYIPVQGGTAGTFTIGTAPTACELSLADFPGIALRDSARRPYTNDAYDDKDPVNIGTQGDFAVTVEDAVVAGDHVYVRVVASGADVRGQFGGERSSSFARLVGARYIKGAAIDAVAVVGLRG